MSNAIDFLNAIGSRPLPFVQYTEVLALFDIEDDEQRCALLKRDPEKLKDLLGGRRNVMMMVWAPQEESEGADDEITGESGTQCN